MSLVSQGFNLSSISCNVSGFLPGSVIANSKVTVITTTVNSTDGTHSSSSPAFSSSVLSNAITSSNVSLIPVAGVSVGTVCKFNYSIQ